MFTITQTYHFNNTKNPERTSKNYFEIELSCKDPFKDQQPCWLRLEDNNG